jgi:glycosyltransferase involved in cell wall biosynthesis
LALHDDPERRETMALAGARTARDRFDVRLMVRRLEDLYRELAER